MKEPERLIREYYAAHHITHGAPLLFLYVRKSTTGGDWAVLEYYAAKYGRVRGKKDRDIVTKLVMKFNPQTNRYAMSDSVIRCESYSAMVVSHLLFDFHKEMHGCRDYSHIILEGHGGSRLYSRRNWRKNCEVMPASEIPLNDFSGTRYQYCKYCFKDSETAESRIHSYRYWARNPYGNLPDYLMKFAINPRAMEMFAANGLVKYMRSGFLTRLRDDAKFAKWYKRHAKETMGDSITHIYALARKDIGVTDWLAMDIDQKRSRREKERRMARRENLHHERMLARRAEQERKSKAERIRELYERLKSICRFYGAYEVVVPKNEREMRIEGKKMHNCVGECYPCCQGVSAIVVFLRKNGKPCVDVEVDPDTFKVVQARFVCNEDADEKTHKIANEIAGDIRKIYKAA